MTSGPHGVPEPCQGTAAQGPYDLFLFLIPECTAEALDHRSLETTSTPSQRGLSPLGSLPCPVLPGSGPPSPSPWAVCSLTLGLLILARGPPAEAGAVLIQVVEADQAFGTATELHHLRPLLHGSHASLH